LIVKYCPIAQDIAPLSADGTLDSLRFHPYTTSGWEASGWLPRLRLGYDTRGRAAAGGEWDCRELRCL